MTRRDIKFDARNMLKSCWGRAVLFSLLFAFCSCVLSFTIVGSLLFSGLLTMVLLNVFLGGCSDTYLLIEPFEENLSQRILLSVMKYIKILLWSLLFLIPGIVKAYAYSLCEYISLRNPDFEYKTCLALSEKMMNGHKMEFFLFQLSFIGWDLLSLLTFGILEILYVMPYRNIACALYLEHLYNDYEAVYGIYRG